MSRKHENHEHAGERELGEHMGGAEPEKEPGPEAPVALTATQDIAARAQVAVSKARSIIGQSWKQLWIDLGTIP